MIILALDISSRRTGYLQISSTYIVKASDVEVLWKSWSGWLELKRSDPFGPNFCFPTRHKLKRTILDPRIPSRPVLVWKGKKLFLYAGEANDGYYVSLAPSLLKRAIYWQEKGSLKDVHAEVDGNSAHAGQISTKAKGLKKKKYHHHHHVKLYLQRCLLYILLSSSTTPSRSPTITTISLPRLVMISGGEKVGEFLFNLIFNLARIERAAMMMMMMSAVVRIFSIRETAAALVFVPKIFHKNGQLVSVIFSPGRGGVSKILRGGWECVCVVWRWWSKIFRKKQWKMGTNTAHVSSLTH